MYSFHETASGTTRFTCLVFFQPFSKILVVNSFALSAVKIKALLLKYILNHLLSSLMFSTAHPRVCSQSNSFAIPSSLGQLIYPPREMIKVKTSAFKTGETLEIYLTGNLVHSRSRYLCCITAYHSHPSEISLC